MSLLALEHITKAYAAVPVLRGVSLTAAAGEVVALLGPSGCGKTTLLRIVAGLEQADSGSVYVAGQAIDGLPVHQRGFGMMFQDYALFPHRDVAANIAFGLRMQRLPARQIAERVAAMLDLVGLAGYGQRRIYELSGGERQRVALARALAPRPRLLMLDEPLAALDRELRERLQDELHTILRQVGVTSIYVTHDQQEAFALADRVVLLNAGRVVQDGPPEVVYRQPASQWAARFLGLSNIVSGICRSDGGVDTALGTLACRMATPVSAGTSVLLVIYPDAAVLWPTATTMPNYLRATLLEQQFRGRFYRVRLRHSSGIELNFELDTPLGQIGTPIDLALRTTGMYAVLENTA